MGSDGSEAAITKAAAAFAAALARGDAAAAAAAYAEDARLVPPAAEPLHGRAAIERFWRAGVDAGISSVELEPARRDHRGRVAYEVGRYALRLTPADGAAVLDRGRYVLVHEQQQDGSWQRAVEMFSPSVPPLPIDAAATGASA